MRSRLLSAPPARSRTGVPSPSGRPTRPRRALFRWLRLTYLLLMVVLAAGGFESACAAPPRYAHPEVLASTEWLAEHLQDPAMRVVDGRNPAWGPDPWSLYVKGHIPGAVFVNVFTDLSDPTNAVPLEILPTEPFAALMSKMGIDNKTTVIVYDDAGGLWAARLWWGLRYYGHDKVQILNGGLTKWQAEGRRTETEQANPAPRTFRAEARPKLLANLAEVKAATTDKKCVLVDSLSPECYRGETNCNPGQPGHIPSALNLFAEANLDPATRTVLGPKELAGLWASLGIKPGQRVITYCGAGYYGAFDLAMLDLLGYKNIALYDGSTLEWTSHPELPVETK